MADVSLQVLSGSPLIVTWQEIPMNPIVTSMAPDDWEIVRLIYEEGIATGETSFETDVPEWDAWSTRGARTGAPDHPDSASDLCTATNLSIWRKIRCMVATSRRSMEMRPKRRRMDRGKAFGL